MTETEAAWLAALLDGEGSIGIAQRGRDADMLNYRLGIYNTSKALIDRLVEVTGITNVYQRTRQQEHHQPCYVWQVGGRDAVFLLQQVRPWLFAKAERADAALAGENFPRQPRWDRIYGKNQQTA